MFLFFFRGSFLFVASRRERFGGGGCHLVANHSFERLEVPVPSNYKVGPGKPVISML